VHDLVHLPALGACKVARVTAETDRSVTTSAVDAGASRDLLGGGTVVAVPRPDLQQSLDSEVPLDPLAGEQTWPSDEEIAESRAMSGSGGAAGEAFAPPPEPAARLVRVPKGTSSYQASWIVDVVDFEGDAAAEADGAGRADGGSDAEMNDGEDDEDDEDDDDDDAADADSDDDGSGGGGGATGQHRKDALEEVSDDGEEGEYDEVDPEDKERDRAKHYDAEMDVEEERAALEASAREDTEFPDEVETPRDVPAKIRFQKCVFVLF
jgi:pre-rRNA-processing protein TSR1